MKIDFFGGYKLSFFPLASESSNLFIGNISPFRREPPWLRGVYVCIVRGWRIIGLTDMDYAWNCCGSS
jgi:hypothetical protein